jgi:hypothetical protein
MFSRQKLEEIEDRSINFEGDYFRIAKTPCQKHHPFI